MDMKAIALAAICALGLTACAPQAAPAETTTPPPEGPRALTQEEIDQVNEAFSPQVERDGVTYTTPVNGFFTSYYSDVKDLDLEEFLRYYPSDGLVENEDQAEFDALAALPGFPFAGEAEELRWTSPNDLPVPTHRIPRASVDETLTRYAGITTADLTDTDGVLYLEGYDAYYNFTSDFGPGMFVCAGGQVDEAAGTALLWTDKREDGSRTELTLEKDGESWHIRAHRNTADDALLEVLAGLEGKDIGSVTWYGPNDPPEADELAALIRNAAAHPVNSPDLTVNSSYADVVWTLDCYLAPKDQGAYSGEDALYLWAGLEENVVEVFGGSHLPQGRVHLEDETLYQLIRTSCDREGFINETFYEKYRDIVDGYYDSRLEELKESGYVSWELTEFLGVLGTTKQQGEGVVAFRMDAAFRTDPPELALRLLAGGAYVDSQLRAHGLDWQNVYLVTLDDEPVGIAFGDEIIGFIEDHWGEDVDPAELQAVMEASTRGG